MNHLQKLAYENMLQARGVVRKKPSTPKGQGTLFAAQPKKPQPYQFDLPADIGPIAQDIVPKGHQQKLPFQEMLPAPRGAKPLPAPSMSNRLVKYLGKHKKHIGAGMLIGGTLTGAAIYHNRKQASDITRESMKLAMVKRAAWQVPGWLTDVGKKVTRGTHNVLDKVEDYLVPPKTVAEKLKRQLQRGGRKAKDLIEDAVEGVKN